MEEIIGHQEIITRLNQAIKTERVGSAYLFHGPTGIGKKLVALYFAQALNCLSSSEDSRPCKVCTNCKKISRRLHPEINIITKEEDAAAIKIKQIWQLQAEIMLRPVESRAKVYIIDNAHLLTSEAANCLLKTLEEPPEACLIILITAQPTLLLPTIVSRCQKINFEALTIGEVETYLREKFNLEKEQAYFLAKFSGGSVGLAQQYYQEGVIEKKQDLSTFLVEMKQQDLAMAIDKAASLAAHKEEGPLTLDLLLYLYHQQLLTKIKNSQTAAVTEEYVVDLLLQAKKDTFSHVNTRLLLENIFLRIKNA